MERIIKPASREMIAALDREFEVRKQEILHTKSEWKVKEGGKVIYISESGKPDNDGLSPEAPMSLFDEINRDGFLNPGDVVLFKRGDRFHQKVLVKPGITYSAYGEGAKPMICGSIDANKPSDWERWGTNEHVYKYTGFIDKNDFRDDGYCNVKTDVGNIVFNDGEYYGARILKYEDRDVNIHIGYNGLASNGKEFWYRGEEEFHDANDLKHNLEFYFDYKTSELYIYSEKGNPGELFEHVDLCMRRNIMHAQRGVTIDNLCLRYGSAHGVGSGNSVDLTVRNCEVGWIGGSIQFLSNKGWPVRFGNGIEIYGTCQNYDVHHNYVHQCFDCGPTVQWAGDLRNEAEDQKIKLFHNIKMYHNAIERCDSPLEVWITTRTEPTDEMYAELKNIRLYDNFCRYPGYGFGGYTHQKYDYNIFYGGGETTARYENAFMEENFMWHIRLYVQFATPTHTEDGKGFHWRNNTIIKPYDSELGLMGHDYKNAKHDFKLYFYNDETIKMLQDGGAFGNDHFYHHMREETER